MRDVNRINVITDRLADAWRRPECQDMRFAQFISNFFGHVMSKYEIADLWFIEDGPMLEMIEDFIDNGFKGEGTY